ncbi:UvrD-helicase domain-containing protein, partial [Paenibacillus ottowii]|uniref:UvrD-helicase domain-containing protein n=1 Tax=Paenibacillus ottowii TaxID=2315729 RepID=UPI003D2F06F9
MSLEMLMIFSEQDIKIIEAVTLDGKCFNDNQKEFINLFETKYIIAGPGVGKTTCLSAKIVLMLMKMASENSRDAICIITHTNVAVDEINRILNRMGISKIKHPHFVGTIHQFFNTYLALPYIKKKLNQDTNPQSIDIIKKIFMNKGNVLQFIGDPNQTLDFDGEKPEVDPGITFELKVCNRFGANIARHLPIIINGVNIQSLNEIVSFDPLMIIYKENKELIPFYKEILMECNYNKDFAKSKRKDSILSIRKDTIQQFEFGRNTQNITGYIPKSTEAYTQHLLKLINELIYKKISSLKSIDFDLKNWIKEHPNQMDIKKTPISDIKLKKLNVSTLRNIINLILNEQISNSINST